jgi:predicted MFS family arabinose efflux permease
MIAVSFGMARYGYGLLLPEMAAELSISPSAAGVISSGTYASYLVANAAVVWLTNRRGPRAAIGLAAALAAGGMAIMAGAHATPVLAVGVLVGGAAAGLAFPPYADLVACRVRPGRRDLAWSAVSSGTGWGVAIAGPIAITVGAHWRTAWIVCAALAAVTGTVAVLLTPASASSRQLCSPRLSWRWFVCPRSRPLLISAALIGTGSAVWWSFSVDALRDAGVAATPARIVYAVCGAAGILASASGTVFGRIGLRRGYLVACIMLAASLAMLGAEAAHLASALAAATLFGAFYNSVVAAQGIWSSHVFADHPAVGLAGVNTALTLGTLAGPSIAGAAIGHLGFPVTLLVAAVVIAAALAFAPPITGRPGAIRSKR